MGAPVGKIELCLDGAARLGPGMAAIAGVAAIWPLHDTFGPVVEDIEGGFDGESDDISKGDPGMVPEYGCAFGFNGTSSTFFVEHDTALQPTTSFAVTFMIQLADGSINNQSTIIRKENGGAGGRIVVYLTTAPAIKFAMAIGGSAREVTYSLTGLVSEWAANPRLICCRYTGSDLEIVQVTNAGVRSTLATAVHSGAVNGGTPSRIYVGSDAGTTEFYEGRLQWIGWWKNGYPFDGHLADLGRSLAWTDVTADVHAADGIDAEWGIRATGPTARLGSAGQLQFSLQNWAKSTRPIGYYSLDHANKRAYFAEGCMVRYSLTDPGTSQVYRRWVGKLHSIDPEPGQYHNAVTRCLATDYFDELVSATLPTMPIVDDYTTGDIVARILQHLPIKPHQVIALDRGVETFAYGFDSSHDTDAVLREFGALADSERAGGIYLRGGPSNNGGIFTFDDRDERPALTTPTWTFSGSMVELEVGRDRSERPNTVRVTVYPRTPGGADTTVLWTLDEPILLAPGEVITIHCAFENADGDPIGGTDLHDPLTSGVDYIGSVNADGTGGDVTAYLSPALTAGSSGADTTIANVGAGGAWITTLQIRGRPIEIGKPITLTAVDAALVRRYGVSLLEVDMPYEDSPLAGQVAADELLATWSAERTMARSMTLRVGQNSDATKTTAAITGDCGDLIAITETQTGLSADEYFIHGVQTHLAAGGVLETTFTLQARE